MTELSVIMPYVNEWPQIAFTIRSVAEELKGIEFEIIAVDNYTSDVTKQGREPDRGHSKYNDKGELIVSHIKSMAEFHPWLKYLVYNEKLSHWNSKRVGVAASQGKFLLFLDAHVIPSKGSLSRMFKFYRLQYKNLNGTIHIPLTYHILETKRLKYKLKWHPEQGELHYGFTGFGESYDEYPVEVPCMSTCGMMMTRELYDYVHGWPSALGIYGGGENYMNFVLAILGKKKWIYPNGTVYHHGEKRGYNWNGDDYTRNRAIATHCFGGKEMVKKFIQERPGDALTLRRIGADAIVKTLQRRTYLKSIQKVDLMDWINWWQEK